MYCRQKWNFIQIKFLVFILFLSLLRLWLRLLPMFLLLLSVDKSNTPRIIKIWWKMETITLNKCAELTKSVTQTPLFFIGCMMWTSVAMLLQKGIYISKSHSEGKRKIEMKLLNIMLQKVLQNHSQRIRTYERMCTQLYLQWIWIFLVVNWQITIISEYDMTIIHV